MQHATVERDIFVYQTAEDVEYGGGIGVRIGDRSERRIGTGKIDRGRIAFNSNAGANGCTGIEVVGQGKLSH